MQDEKNIKVDRQSFRLFKWFDDKLESYMEQYKVDKTKAIHGLYLKQEEKIKTLTCDNEKYRQMLMIENPPSTELSNKANIDCIYYLHPDQCLKDWLKKGVIRKVNHSICNICLILKQEQRQADKLKEAKSTKALKPQTSALYKNPATSTYRKPQDIYCLQDNRWLNPLKIQAKCKNCEHRNTRIWGECQRQYAQLLAKLLK